MISTLSPQAILTFKSCLIDPSPLLTILVSLSSEPRASADCLACSGLVMSGSVAISTRGRPNLSNVYVTISPSDVTLDSSFLAESSSSHITEIPTSPLSVLSIPLVETSVVLWKPLVFDPSTTVFLIGCKEGTGLA